jgi:hypothetical protein
MLSSILNFILGFLFEDFVSGDVRKREVLEYLDETFNDEYVIEFRYDWLKGYHVIYCFDHPPCPYPRNTPKDHLYGDGRISVTEGKEPKTRDKAKAIAQVWMNGWSCYIRTGHFSNRGRKVYVPDESDG